MKLVRSDSPEVVHSIASAGAWASRNWPTLGFVCIASVLSVLIALAASLLVSVRLAACLSLPILLSLNGYVLWRAKVSHRRWVVAGIADRLYVRLFAWRSGLHTYPDVLVLEASEIASMSIKTLEVFVYGPKPKNVEWLAIEPTRAISEEISRHIRRLLTTTDQEKAVLVAHEDERLIIHWKWWRPALRTFLQQLVEECPSVVIGREERSELDLNGIWNGIRWAWKKPDPQQRQLLVQAMRLGFGCECAALLSRHRGLSFKQAAAYLVEIQREEPETGSSAV